MTEVLALLKAAWDLLRARPWIALLAVIALQAVTLHFRTADRDVLRAWQTDVTKATRDAAGRPKLAEKWVAQQVRYLGQGVDKMRLGMAQARADALAAKIAKEAADETNRKEFDHALGTALSAALRDSDSYARAHGVWGDTGSPAGADHGNDGRADLPGGANAAGLADRSGAGPALVSIHRAAFDTCTTLKVRLDNAHAWALEPRP